MAWGRRQERLRSMVGAGTKAFGSARKLLEPPPQMCFQVFALVHERGYCDKRFDDLVQKHNIELHEKFNWGSFKPNVEPLDSNYEGRVRIEKDSRKFFSDILMQSVFTTLDSQIIKQLNEFYDDPKMFHRGNEILNTVAQNYWLNIQVQFPNMDIRSKIQGYDRYKGGATGVSFYFAIQPYTSDLCPPEDLDVLKPITIIDGHVIHPETDRLDLSTVKVPSRHP